MIQNLLRRQRSQTYNTSTFVRHVLKEARPSTSMIQRRMSGAGIACVCRSIDGDLHIAMSLPSADFDGELKPGLTVRCGKSNHIFLLTERRGRLPIGDPYAVLKGMVGGETTWSKHQGASHSALRSLQSRGPSTGRCRADLKRTLGLGGRALLPVRRFKVIVLRQSCVEAPELV